MNPEFPLYIPSKGRADSRITIRYLQAMGVPFYVVVESQEYAAYAEHVPKSNILVLDPAYQRDYDTFDDLGDSKSKGPGAARNFAWDHSISNGFPWHWVMDDNINRFYRLNRNTIIKVNCGGIFRAMEAFVQQYDNIAMAGPNYEMFVPRRNRHPPFIMNTRIYSCNLIRNDVPFRWRGRYNEDTDLSLRMLKAKWCTVQFNAFLQNKVWTQQIAGGNTKEFYAKEGTRPKSEMLQRMHPDVTEVVWRFGRVHHVVDYSPFKGIKLIRSNSIKVPRKPNEYGMKLKRVK